MSPLEMLLVALVLGVVEGLTEFLPISSTGHLILASSILGFTGRRAEVFTIFIQQGAILAVVWEYRTRLLGVVTGVRRRPEARRFVVNVVLAFLPSAAIGLALYPWISRFLFRPASVAASLIVGGVLILVVEALHLRVRTRHLEEISRLQSVWIGFAQCLALWPGFSRSAATILGGLGVGLDRRTATQFSFMLAIPTMFAATTFNLYQNRSALEPDDAGWLAISFLVSFVVAWMSIRWLLRYVSSHGFGLFAWYRIALGLLTLLLL